MGDRATNNSNASNKSKSGNNFFRMRNRFNTLNRDTGPRQPVVSLPIPSNLDTNARSTIALSASNNADDSKYIGWKLYFPEIEFKEDLQQLKKIKAFKHHIKGQPLFYNLNEIRERLWFPLSLHRLMDDEKFNALYPNFIEEVNNATMGTLSCAGLAAHQLIITDSPPILTSQASATKHNAKMTFHRIYARLQGHTPIDNLGTLQHRYNRIISVRGTVVRVNPPDYALSWLTYSCSLCKTEQVIKQNDSLKIVSPTSCKGTGCRSRSNFRALRRSSYTRFEIRQTIRLQESIQSVKGQIPKTIDVDLAHDLVHSAYPGDDITVTGIIKVRTQEKSGFQNRQRGTDTGLHQFYIHGINVVNNKNQVAVRNLDFNDSELQMIEKLRQDPNIFKLFVHSLCTLIFGHEMVKAGLILSLFGGSGNGTNGEKMSGNRKRSEIHVLIVGDPGLGKSLLIQSCANVSPRGVFVCGNATTYAGLTASIRHDKSSDGSLEAGALVLADQGICCIDEFDKMSSSYQSLLQVMEQQTVSVAKAGVLCALPARTTILAAANPSGGHYNKGKTVSENLKIWPTILSRFDLVFILLDKADQHLDTLLTAHIQALKANQTEAKLSGHRSNSTQFTPFSISNNKLTPEQDGAPLYERLKLSDMQNFQPLPVEIIRKYILYARKYCFPTISPEAVAELTNFYKGMRTSRPGIDSVPVTTRQLEALIRMTQARARIELATEATVCHAKDVLAILRYTMVDVLSTDRGTLQMSRSFNGTGISRSVQVKRFLLTLQQQMKIKFSALELSEISISLGFEFAHDQIIESLNVQGFLLKTGVKEYKLIK